MEYLLKSIDSANTKDTNDINDINDTNNICTDDIDVNINEITNKDGKTALHSACEYGHLNCVKMLLNKSLVDMNILTKRTSESAIHISVKNKRFAISDFLINNNTLNLSKNSLTKLWYYCIKYDDSSVFAKLDERKSEFNIISPVTFQLVLMNVTINQLNCMRKRMILLLAVIIHLCYWQVNMIVAL